MIRAALVGIVAALACAASALASPTIYVSNAATNVTDASLADALPAFQAAVDEDFAPAWQQSTTLVQLAPGQQAPAGAWTIEVSDTSDTFGAAGYHSITGADIPYARVFTREGINWQLVFSHELFELLADPHVDRATFIWPTATFYVLEVCDPVEAQRWAYTRPSATGQPVVISDFVTERWYDEMGGAALDFGGHVRHALHVLYGGYASVFSHGSWDAERVHGRRAAIFR